MFETVLFIALMCAHGQFNREKTNRTLITHCPVARWKQQENLKKKNHLLNKCVYVTKKYSRLADRIKSYAYTDASEKPKNDTRFEWGRIWTPLKKHESRIKKNYTQRPKLFFGTYVKRSTCIRMWMVKSGEII